MSKLPDDQFQAAIADALATDVLALAQGQTQLVRTSGGASTGDEYHGPCPRCGGHDRFTVLTGPNRWFCRKCTGHETLFDAIALYGLVHHGNHQLSGRTFVDAACALAGLPMTAGTAGVGVHLDTAHKPLPLLPKVEPRLPVSPEERQALLSQFHLDEITAELHARMTDENRNWWTSRGITPDWQDFWQLGYTPDKIISYKDQTYHTPAYTIPYVDMAFQPVNTQYRLINPPDPGDKYRWHGVGYSSAFIARPDLGLTNHVFIGEGAIKGMNAAMYCAQKSQVLCVPGNTDLAGVIELLQGTEREVEHIWIVLDPDCWKPPKPRPLNWQPAPQKLARALGERARIVRLPGKWDDLILAGWGPSDMQTAMHQARQFVL